MVDIKETLVAPDLSVLIDRAKNDIAKKINCVQVGEIQSFDAVLQLASVKISINQVTEIDENGVRTIKEYPLLLECPVFTLQGGGDYISFPINAGDSCIILFNDRQIDDWLNFGAGQPPTVARFHDISDGIALVGINPISGALNGVLTNGIRLSHNGDSASINMTDGLIKSMATTLQQNGDLEVTGNSTVDGILTVTGAASLGGGGTMTGNLDVSNSITGGELHADDGATGTFTTVTVVDGIVISGS